MMYILIDVIARPNFSEAEAISDGKRDCFVVRHRNNGGLLAMTYVF